MLTSGVVAIYAPRFLKWTEQVQV